MAIKKPKKPMFNASSLPKSKGITARPTKMKDASPNYVNEMKVEEIKGGRGYRQRLVNDPGTNPGGSPVIKYKPSSQNSGVNMRIMKPSGNFEYDKQGMSCGLPSCDKPIKNKDLSGGKKGTKPAPKKAMPASSKKMAPAKKSMMKSTKKK